MKIVSIAQAAEILQNGGNIIMPTETVFGLAADATNDLAVLNIYNIKNRPSHNPLIIHFKSVEAASREVKFCHRAENLSKKLMPGPLTMVLKRNENSNISSYATANLNTLAIRVPSDPSAHQILTNLDRPVAAPSANRSGYLSSTKVDHLTSEFEDIPIAYSNSNVKYGLESTIIDLTTDVPTILRYGFITPDLISEILEEQVQIANVNDKVKAPGMLLKHYSPFSKLTINLTDDDVRPDQQVIVSFGSCLAKFADFSLSEGGDLAEAASNLYNILHSADLLAQSNGKKQIAVAQIENLGIGLAINDRLSRGAEESKKSG